MGLGGTATTFKHRSSTRWTKRRWRRLCVAWWRWSGMPSTRKSRPSSWTMPSAATSTGRGAYGGPRLLGPLSWSLAAVPRPCLARRPHPDPVPCPPHPSPLTRHPSPRSHSQLRLRVTEEAAVRDLIISNKVVREGLNVLSTDRLLKKYGAAAPSQQKARMGSLAHMWRLAPRRTGRHGHRRSCGTWTLPCLWTRCASRCSRSSAASPTRFARLAAGARLLPLWTGR